MNPEKKPQSNDHQSFRAPTDDVSDAEQNPIILRPENITFDESALTLLLNLRHDDVPSADLAPAASTQGIAPKPELHITAIGRVAGAEIQRAIQQRENADLTSEIANLIHQADFSFTLAPTRLHIIKDYPTDPEYPDREPEHRESFIQMVEVPGLHKLYNDINALLGTHVEPPPTHITLYTGSTYPENASQGIGIHTPEDLEKINKEEIPASFR